jgi:hypothetical protein
MAKQPQSSPLDPLEQVMSTVVQGFKMTTSSIQELKTQTAKLEQKLHQQARAAYHGMTGSGKSRYTAELVKIESESNPRGAQARVADTLGVTPGRVTQLLSSEKNRKNGK